MNIFILDQDIQVCAKCHVDKHVVKMRLESAQLGSFVHHLTTGQGPYKFVKSFSKHPCTKWMLESLDNYNWVINLALELCNEMRYRFGTEEQKVESTLKWLLENKPPIPSLGLTKAKLAMPDFCKIHESADPIGFGVLNYREYYNQCKTHIFKWTKRETPEWISKP